jgi:hypothetical protein
MSLTLKTAYDNIQLKFKLTNWAGKKRIAEIAKMTPQELEEKRNLRRQANYSAC